jgi:hypothetical protein
MRCSGVSPRRRSRHSSTPAALQGEEMFILHGFCRIADKCPNPSAIIEPDRTPFRIDSCRCGFDLGCFAPTRAGHRALTSSSRAVGAAVSPHWPPNIRAQMVCNMPADKAGDAHIFTYCRREMGEYPIKLRVTLIRDPCSRAGMVVAKCCFAASSRATSCSAASCYAAI